MFSDLWVTSNTWGTTDSTDVGPHQLSHTTVVLNSAILVFREGLETVLVLAVIVASFCGADHQGRGRWFKHA